MTDPPGVTGTRSRLPVTLLAAAHPGPAFAVTVLAGLLSVAMHLPADRVVLVVAAVLTGQLSIGWSNDLLDVARDRRVGRTDKPLATGAVPLSAARTACVVAVVLTIPLGLACGLAVGGVHLLGTAAGWVYNLGMKGTVWSWLPYVVCFGGLPVLVALARTDPALPAVWLPVVGALLGVGAHLLNVLPDLADDAATGVRGLPHRLGARRTSLVAVTLLAVASVVAVVGAGVSLIPAVLAFVVVAALALFALRGAGRVPFLAAVGIALVDVVLLVAAS
ncbi:MAG: UbiA prenyltransferase [Nocardioidaceae bacterium]|nr:UbiA prenyltransferase [Nocardioidaceae bacterium]